MERKKQMSNSWLVQRLRAPMGGVNPFSFGGGYKNGGLSDQAADLLRAVWSFDYMGAAEFEFGAVPKALNAMMSDRKHLATFTVDGLARPVFVVCPEAWRDGVTARIEGWADPDCGKRPRTKESVRLHDALVDETDEWAPVGWLELDNGFLFFVDETMWRNACHLFGIELAAVDQ